MINSSSVGTSLNQALSKPTASVQVGDRSVVLNSSVEITPNERAKIFFILEWREGNKVIHAKQFFTVADACTSFNDAVADYLEGE